MRSSKPGPTKPLSEVWAAFQEERLGHLAIKTQQNYTQAARLIPASRKAAGAYSSQDVYNLIKHLKPGAYMVARGFFSSLFTFAIRRGWAASNPVAYVETRKLGKVARWPRDRVPEGISKINDEEARLVLETMYASGQRLSDILAAKPENLCGVVLKLHQKKTGNLVEVPLGQKIADRLVALEPNHGKPFFKIRPSEVWKVWRRAKMSCAEEATMGASCGGFAKLTPHGLRKSASCEAAEGGASEAELQAMLGHRTSRAAAIYRLDADRAILASSAMSKRGLSETRQ